MSRDLYTVITRIRSGINTSMNFWRELLINLVYLAAVLALVYILTMTDIVSHLLAY
jgi:anti-sigma-K factor RskA